jgi:hypothetical protein
MLKATSIGDEVLETLLESKPKGSRSPAGAIASVTTHTATDRGSRFCDGASARAAESSGGDRSAGLLSAEPPSGSGVAIYARHARVPRIRTG